MGQIIFEEEQKYFYPKIIGDIGIRGPPDLRWIRSLNKTAANSLARSFLKPNLLIPLINF